MCRTCGSSSLCRPACFNSSQRSASQPSLLCRYAVRNPAPQVEVAYHYCGSTAHEELRYVVMLACNPAPLNIPLRACVLLGWLQGRVEELQQIIGATSPPAAHRGGSMEWQQAAAVTPSGASQGAKSLPSTPHANYNGYSIPSANGNSTIKHSSLKHMFSASEDFSQRPLVSSGSLPSPYSSALSASLTSLGRGAVRVACLW